MNFDLVAVLALVGLALAFVVRKYWRSAKGKGPACGNCGNCGSDN
ncbi:FeoB-associated Cys-rich membrane protein [Hydrogenophaga sp. PAMC20947]|nr:FeoB-associated Cys-rich membrane protein [Hydrogenophaga sp. PAMC20947]QCB46515.1 FeoB-associated Cys-rich membrane protein [Hydrogenophaga sp. PAMC20947]